jgi:hypothetical protein
MIAMKARTEMSEPITPLNVSQPANTNEVVPKDRRKFQFSIRSMLLFTLIVALVITSVHMYRRMSEVEQELVKLRTLAGYMKIEDETLFQALALQCEEPLTWKWRVFMPKGSKYSWHLNSGDFPESGVLNGGVSSVEQTPRPAGVESIITVSIRKDPEPKNKRWDFVLSSRSTEGDKKESMTTSIPDVVMDKILQSGCSETYSVGDLKPETSKRGELIILLKRRIGEQSSPNSWTTSSKPQPGFAVWLNETK